MAIHCAGVLALWVADHEAKGPVAVDDIDPFGIDLFEMRFVIVLPGAVPLPEKKGAQDKDGDRKEYGVVL